MTTIDELVENFELLGEWEERYSYIVDLGAKLPGLPDEEKTEENRVHGCNSNAWVRAGFDDSHPPVFEFEADGDAIIVKGLLELARIIYRGKTAQEVLDTDIQGFFDRIGLMEHLSPTRQQGLGVLVSKIRGLASDQLSRSRG
jgi:cysteine desulfuration protein SufE